MNVGETSKEPDKNTLSRVTSCGTGNRNFPCKRLQHLSAWCDQQSEDKTTVGYKARQVGKPPQEIRKLGFWELEMESVDQFMSFYTIV